MSTRSSAATAPAGAALAPRRRARRWRGVATRRLPAYLLLLPSAAVIGAVLGYPIYFLVRLSFQRYDLPELIKHQGVWIGVENYTTIFHDAEFWHVLGRTAVFTIVNVSLTMVLGTLIALLLA